MQSYSAKKIIYDEEARTKLASGADQLARAVVATLGPRSRNVTINQPWPAPWTIHDGVNVARQIRLENPFEDMGAVLLREAATKTNELAGDGTTTATLLANTLIQEGMKLIKSGVDEKGAIRAASNPMVLRDELFNYSDIILGKLDEMKREIKTDDDIKSIATISSANPEIGDLVAQAVQKVGKDGIILVEEAEGFDTTLEMQEGMTFDNGYLSIGFVTDPGRMIVDYQDAYILLTDLTISDPNQIVPIIEKVTKEGNNKKALLIIANDVIGAALMAMVQTKLRLGTPLVAVVAPEFADRRREMLEDIAILTGGVVITHDGAKSLTEVELSDLGRARNIFVTQTHTSITPSYPDPEEIKERVDSLRKQIAEEENSFRKDRLQERLAKLSEGVAIISVGGATQSEIKEKKERIIDAVHATKAAIAEGIVVGGGMALRQIISEIGTLEAKNLDALSLIVKMLEAPFKQILLNSGENPDEIEKLLDGKSETMGYNVVTREVVDMFKEGLIDPVKVTKMAVKNAISCAATMLTTNVLITDLADFQERGSDEDKAKK